MTDLQKVVGAIIAAAFMALGVEIAVLKHELAARDRAAATRIAEKAPDLGAVVGRPVSAGKAEAKTPPAIQDVVTKLRKEDPGVQVVERSDNTFSVDDFVPLPDPHRRIVPADGGVERREEYRIDSVIVTGSDGETRVMKTAVTEVDPWTGVTISDASSAPRIVTHFDFVKEAPAAPPILHPRAVAAFGYAGDGALLGAGVELLNLERLGGPWAHTNVSILGMYDTKTKKGAGAAVFGIRPFNWNVSVGPAYFFPSGHVGAAATIELTR